MGMGPPTGADILPVCLCSEGHHQSLSSAEAKGRRQDTAAQQERAGAVLPPD